MKLIWTSLIVLIIIGFRPFRFPCNPNNTLQTELLVEFHEYTCSPDFEIVDGQLNIPDRYKLLLKDNTQELNVSGIESPLKLLNDGDLQFLTDNQFVISGKIVGVDSSARTCSKTALFEIDKWSPTKYYAIFWTFKPIFFITYFFLLFSMVLTIIILYLKQKNKRIQS